MMRPISSSHPTAITITSLSDSILSLELKTILRIHDVAEAALFALKHEAVARLCQELNVVVIGTSRETD